MQTHTFEKGSRLIRSVTIWKHHNGLSNRQFILFLSLIIGIGAGLAAHILKLLIKYIEYLLTNKFDITHSQWEFFLYPLVGIGITALFTKYIVRDNIGHGITKILYSISRRQGHIKSHNCWSSIIASAITIGFGGSVGGESPIVLTGSAIGSTLGEAFHLDHKNLMLLIGCGASAAISGIFKAPIAGLVFTLEVLLIDLTMASLLPLLISSMTATCVAYALTGTEAMFQFHLYHPFNVERVPSSILLGIFCGFISLYFTRTMNRFEQWFGRIKNMYARIGLGGSILAVLIYFFPPLYGEGYTTINTILSNYTNGGVNSVMNNSLFYGHAEYLILFLSLAVIFKVFATTATNCGGGCGGTFAPSLFLGCLAGFVFSRVWNNFELFNMSLPERNYALLGMAGLMSGAFHAPLLGIFLIAELTGGYALFIPLMIVAATSYLTINIFERHSIYTMRLARKGELLTHDKDKSILTLMTLDAIIEKDSPQLSPDMNLGEIVQTVSKGRAEDYAVTNAEGQFMGILNLKSIRRIIFRTELYRRYTAKQLMQAPASILNIDDPMTIVVDKFQDPQVEVLPVLKPDNTFVGFVTKAHLFELYRKILKDFSEE